MRSSVSLLCVHVRGRVDARLRVFYVFAIFGFFGIFGIFGIFACVCLHVCSEMIGRVFEYL